VDWPLAYFITFRTYGTWLPGDDRGSVDRDHDQVGEPTRRDGLLVARAVGQMAADARVLTEKERVLVKESIERRCTVAGWELTAINVRTNHVHVVVAAPARPEVVLGSLKSWATRDLRDAGLAEHGERLWARHGSTRYLWEPGSVERAVDYVDNWQ
jgi:REP element-mobilizing transposase RayT